MLLMAFPLVVASLLAYEYGAGPRPTERLARASVQSPRQTPRLEAPVATRRVEVVKRSRDYFRTGPPRLRAIARALELLPEPPAAVQVFNGDEASLEIRARIARLDAFIARGSRVVYVTKHSLVLQRASGGSVFHTYVLAAIIWHEMAHLAGADESTARQLEETLWTQFLLDNHLDRNMALAYQRILRNRGPVKPHAPLATGAF
jgi:hypothetical protein